MTSLLMCVGFPDWCVCDNCVQEPPRKQVCCGRDPANCWSVTTADELNDAVVNLTDDDLNTEAALFTSTAPPESIAAASPAQKRLLCYRKIFRIFHGIGQLGVQVNMPSCVRKSVPLMYPDRL